MLNLPILFSALAVTLAPLEATPQDRSAIPLLLDAPEAYKVTCFLKGEKISGMNKICYYDCLGSEAAITIKSYEICPITIEREQ